MTSLHSAAETPVVGPLPTGLPAPTPTTNDTLPLARAAFGSLAEALDYAARGETGLNFYDGKGALETALPYETLRTEARLLARHLLGLGLARGDRVGVIASMTPDFVTTFFACQYAGLLCVPLPVVTGLGGRIGYQAQLTRVLTSSGAKIALGMREHLTDLHQALDGLTLQLVGTNQEVLACPPVDESALRPFAAHEDSHIQYSSGSTRYPLGVTINQHAFMANARAVAEHGLDMRAGDRCASWLPFYHDMGLIGFLLIPMTCQMSIDFINTDSFARRPMLWLEIIARNRCTLSFSPTFGYEVCARRAARRSTTELDLSCWRAAGIGGEMVQPEIMSNFAATFADTGFRETAFVPSYGLAEVTLAFSFTALDHGVVIDTVDKASLAAGGVLAATPAHPENARQFAGCGAPLPGYAMQIRDENNRPLAERHVGCVYVKGPSLMTGYFEHEDDTDMVIDADGWLNTGDMGYVSQGQLFITGRQKDLIIINGRNIWPQDIEWHAESEIPELRTRDTAAFAVEDAHGKEHAVLLVHCRLLDSAARIDLRHRVHAAVFRNGGVDVKVVLIPSGSLPFTTSGKLSRAKAKLAYIKGELCDVEPA
ncbi:MAG: fatty acyl-AMP ligase [Alphaproteobacteria bacterium]|nr:fatty acyl-AMP ligase [Alphaproteobacteria bacterium]